MSLDRHDPADIGGHALSAVSWAAVFAGAATTLATAFTLDLAGAGFGLTMSSPWLQTRASLAGFDPVSGAWTLAAGVSALALGGYVAGRLRTHWRGVDAAETHFRDTAHGLLVWALSTIVGVVLTAMILAPYAAAMADVPVVVSMSSPGAPPSVLAAALSAHAERATHIAAQASLFGAVGLFLGAFVSGAAAALGGMQRDEAVVRRLN